MDERKMIGHNISQMRRRRGYTQAQLAELLNDSVQYVGRIEQKGILSLQTIKKFAEPLHTAPQFLLPEIWIPFPLTDEDFKDQLFFYASQLEDPETRRHLIQVIKEFVQKHHLP